MTKTTEAYITSVCTGLLDAERVWRSMWLAAQDEKQKVDAPPNLP